MQFTKKIFFLGFLILILTAIFLSAKHHTAQATTDCPGGGPCYCYPRNVSFTATSCDQQGKFTAGKVSWDGSNCGFYSFNFYDQSTGQIGSDNLGHSSTGTENYTFSSLNATNGPIGVGTKDPKLSSAQITYDTHPTVSCTVGKDYDCSKGQTCQSPLVCTAGKCEPASTPAPTSTPTPTAPLTPTPTPGPVPTKGDITLKFEGIGNDPGETSNPHPNRQISLYFYPSTDTSFQSKPKIFSGQVGYNSPTGYFSNHSFPLTGLGAGQYLVLVRSLQGSLMTQIGTGDGTGPITIVTAGGANMLVDTQDNQDTNADTTVPELLMGDLVTSDPSFNTVDALDYSMVKDCFGATADSQSDTCKAHAGIIDPTTQVLLPDLNDDGVVDGIDYTMMLRNFHHSVVGPQTNP